MGRAGKAREKPWQYEGKHNILRHVSYLAAMQCKVGAFRSKSESLIEPDKMLVGKRQVFIRASTKWSQTLDRRWG